MSDDCGSRLYIYIYMYYVYERHSIVFSYRCTLRMWAHHSAPTVKILQCTHCGICINCYHGCRSWRSTAYSRHGSPSTSHHFFMTFTGPVPQQIEFKLAVLAFRCLHGMALPECKQCCIADIHSRL